VEEQLRLNAHGNRLPRPSAGIEAPAAHGVDRLLVETESIVERPDDTDASDRAVREDDDLEHDETFDARAHRV
jgi:hypothetical protein